MHAEYDLIAEIETRAACAWPALETIEFDGWALRFAGGFTRRANSVQPRGASTMPLEEKIRRCEEHYEARSLPAIFRITPVAEPGVEAALAVVGYRKFDETQVRVRELGGAGAAGDTDAGVVMSSRPSESWLGLQLATSERLRRHEAVWRRMLHAIQGEAAFAEVRIGGEAVAGGLGVIDDGWLGLFQLVTHPGHRRRGHGERVTRTLLDWAGEREVATAYLQVHDLSSGPAVALYEKLGFVVAYSYGYMAPSASPDAEA